ncbi:MAG: thioredoxin family protein, partial [Bacteroidetes bacterium]|nr:thioredoxin family protein [Bacteroidota bacterium]
MLTMFLAGSSCGERPRDEAGEAAGTSDSSRLVTLHNDSFDAFLERGGPVLIEFGGKRCIPCMEMRDILEEVGALRPDLRLGIVFWEDDPEQFERWKVPLIPAQIIFDGNRELTRHRGSWERDSVLA